MCVVELNMSEMMCLVLLVKSWECGGIIVMIEYCL